MTSRGMERLAQTIRGAIARQTAVPPVMELGVIQPDMSLKVDRFSRPIPAGDYLVCRHLNLPDPLVTTEEALTGDLQHTHAVPRPEKLAPLKPGDRVLVAWVDDDPVVIDVVVMSSA